MGGSPKITLEAFVKDLWGETWKAGRFADWLSGKHMRVSKHREEKDSQRWSGGSVQGGKSGTLF